MTQTQQSGSTDQAPFEARVAPSPLQRLVCRGCFERPAGSDQAPQWNEPAPPANAEGVAALLEIGTATVDDERQRGRALDAKTASLAGFTGLILSVNAGLAKTLFEQNLGPIGRPIAQGCFLIAVLSLLAAVLVAILGILMPQKYRGLGREDIRNFTSAHVQAHDALWVHQSMLGALDAILAQDRPVNDCKAKLTKWVAATLALGFAAVAGEALTLGLRQIGA